MTQKKEVENHVSSLCDEIEDKHSHSPKPSSILAGKIPEEIYHERRLYQNECEIQNKELKKAYIALESSRNKYIELYDFSPVGYFTLTEENLIAEVNLTGAEMFRIVRRDLILVHFRQFVASKNFVQWDHFFQKILKQGVKQTCTLHLNRKDGTGLYARIEGIRVVIDDRSFQVRIVMSDVTDRMQEEEDPTVATISQGHNITGERSLEQEKNAVLVQIQQNLAQFAILNDEIRNPLTIIISCVDMLDDAQLIDQILVQVQRIDEIVRNLDQRWNESTKVLNAIRKHYMVYSVQPEQNRPKKLISTNQEYIERENIHPAGRTKS